MLLLGWLASQIVRGYGCGLIGNVMIGIIAVVVARWLLPLAGFVIIGLARLPAEG